MSFPEVSTAEDYATLSAGGLHFYYGYEYATTPEGDAIWGFEARSAETGARAFGISADHMKVLTNRKLDHFNVTEMLLIGIGLYLEQGVGR